MALIRVLLLLIGSLLMADTILWEDDFEAGTALSVDYTGIIDCENAAGVGESGSRGARTTGSASEQYNGEFTKTVDPGAERAGFAEAAFDHEDAGNLSGGLYAIELRKGGFFFLSLYHDVNTNALRVELQNDVDFPNPTFTSANDVYAIGTFSLIRLEWLLSTITAFVSNADGEFRVYVDDVLVLEETGQHITGDVNDPTWDDVAVGPMGNLDNLKIGIPGEDAPVEVEDLAELCCSDGEAPTVASGGGQGAGATPVQTPSIGSQLSCAGGGTVPTQADLVHAETWWGA